jgi:hypothetical protein
MRPIYVIQDLGRQDWANYHETLVRDGARLARFVGGPSPAAELLASSAGAMQRMLGDALETSTEIVACGSAWSYSDLLDTDGVLVETSQLSWVSGVSADMLEDPDATDFPHLVLAGSGTTIKDLNTALESHGLSMRTSGSHNGPSIVGAIATATHGSALGFGGVQNQVRGLHIVTGPLSSLWIEPADGPRLAHGFVKSFASEVIRDDALFDAALIHLGGLGFINAVLLAATDLFKLELVQEIQPPRREWMHALADGDFGRVAAALGHDEQPYFYEMDFNPFDPFGQPAFHTLMFRRPEYAPGAVIYPGQARRTRLDLVAGILGAAPPQGDGFDLPVLYEGVFDVFPTADGERVFGTWGQLNHEHEKQLVQLYSAAFAIERRRLPQAIDAIWGAVAGMKRDFLGSMRFVSNAAGAMAFTRFRETCIINLDGAGPEEIANSDSAEATAKVLAALDAAQIDYSLHWGKQGDLSAAKVAADYDRPAPGGSRLAAWRAARERFLEPHMRAVFGNAALRRLRII